MPLTKSAKDYNEGHVDFKAEDVNVKVRVISYSNAVIKPLAMMIESLHTSVADVAMP